MGSVTQRVKDTVTLANALTQRAADLTVDAPPVVKRLLRERRNVRHGDVALLSIAEIAS
jgi:hypothetical protein